MMERQLRLMQSDHKATFENTTMSIKQHNEQIKTLRKENKELAQALTRLAKDGSAFSAATFQQREITNLDVKINTKRRGLDEIRAKNEQSRKHLGEGVVCAQCSCG
eukprot:gene28483-63416_t